MWILCFVDIYERLCFVQAQTWLGWVDPCKSSTEVAATRAIGEQQHRWGLSRTWPQSQMVRLLQSHMESLLLCAPLEICNDVQRQHGPWQKYLLYLFCSNRFLTIRSRVMWSLSSHWVRGMKKHWTSPRSITGHSWESPNNQMCVSSVNTWRSSAQPWGGMQTS